MVVKLKVYEFDTVDELKEFEGKEVRKSVDYEVHKKAMKDFKEEKSLKELEREQKEAYEGLIEEEKKLKRGKGLINFDTSRPMFRKKWKKKDDALLKKLVKEQAKQGNELSVALDNISEALGRSKDAIISRLSTNRILYSKLLKKTIKTEEINSSKNKAWSREDDLTLARFINNDLKTGKRTKSRTYKKLSKQLGRTIPALKKRVESLKQQGLIGKGVVYDTDKEVEVKIVTKKGWTAEFEQYAINKIKQHLKSGKKNISKKLYDHLSKKSGLKHKTLKDYVYDLKRKGKLPYSCSEEMREKKVRKMLKARKKLNGEDKKPESDKGYMKSRTPSLPTIDRIRGKLKEFIPLFSKNLSQDQNELLKAMIQNDIKNSGVSKVTFQKLSYIMNIDLEGYERLLLDIADNNKRIKNGLEIGVISIQKEGNSNSMIFS